MSCGRYWLPRRLRTPTAPDKESHREWVRQRVHDLAERGYGALALPKEYGGRDDFGSYSVVFEMLGYHDGSLAIKFGVQFGLFAGSIANLGTADQHDRWLAAAGRGELQGCFAMTEDGARVERPRTGDHPSRTDPKATASRSTRRTGAPARSTSAMRWTRGSRRCSGS